MIWTGRYGDSTRTVKAVGSQAVPGGAGVAARFPPLRSISRPRGRPRWTPTAALRIRPGGNWNRRWRSWKARRRRWCSARGWRPSPRRCGCWPNRARCWSCPPTATTRFAAYASEYLAPLGITVGEARCADMYDAAAERRRGARRNPANPGARRHRPASAGDDLPRPRRDAARRQHHRHAVGAASAVAGRRPGGGQRHQGAVRPQRPACRIRGGQSPRSDGRDGARTAARGPDPRRLRGLAGVAQPRQRRSALRAAVPQRPGAGA